MQYMLIMRANDEAVDAYEEIPFEEVLERMGKYNEAMMEAGGSLEVAEVTAVLEHDQLRPGDRERERVRDAER
ncbi:hypothetical protein [Agrococcus sp. TSP3-2-1]|uniref:hypothetical protein n=1 Tax=Agrococcus sp. TSP3-2-1 TaxID=2804583 RepID=UPI003CEE78FC